MGKKKEREFYTSESAMELVERYHLALGRVGRGDLGEEEWRAELVELAPQLVLAVQSLVKTEVGLRSENERFREAEDDAHADTYYQLIGEFDVEPGGSLVEAIDAMRHERDQLKSRLELVGMIISGDIQIDLEGGPEPAEGEEWKGAGGEEEDPD